MANRWTSAAFDVPQFFSTAGYIVPDRYLEYRVHWRQLTTAKCIQYFHGFCSCHCEDVIFQKGSYSIIDAEILPFAEFYRILSEDLIVWNRWVFKETIIKYMFIIWVNKAFQMSFEAWLNEIERILTYNSYNYIQLK